MKKFLLLFCLAPFFAFAQNNVTFRLDMSQYTGTFTTPDVAGQFNSFCGGCAPLADPDGDNIWELTVAITADSTEYLFTVDTFADQETLTPGSACTKTTGQFTNRFIKITGDTVLPIVCWESCTDCGSTPVTSNVTFRLDMSEYTGSFTTPEVNGQFNGFCGNCAQMDDSDGDDIWEITIPITADSTEFIFSVDNFSDQESWTGGEPCTKTTGQFTNRFLTLNGDITLPAYCWESCTPCGVSSLDNEIAETVNVYPNPSQGKITLFADKAIEAGSTVTISDMQGKVVLNKTIEQTVTEYDITLDDVKAGMLILSIQTETSNYVQTIIVE